MKTKLITITLISLVGILMMAGQAMALESPWPMFQHDAQNTGRSSFVGPQTNNLKWTFPKDSNSVDNSYHALAIDHNGTLYFEGNGKIHALNPDGTQKWLYDLVSWGTTLGLDGTIYASYGTKLLAINQNGALKWEQDLEGAFSLHPNLDSKGNLYLIASSPLSDNDYRLRLIKVTPSGAMQYLFEVQSEDYFDVRNIIPTIDLSGTIYLSFNNVLYAINPDGFEKWKRTFYTGCNNYNDCEKNKARVTTPSIDDDGTIYMGVQFERYNLANGYGGCLHAINPENSEDKWVNCFSFSCDGAFSSLPIIGPDGTVYIFERWSHSGYIYHVSLIPIDPLSGEKKYGKGWSYTCWYSGCDPHSLPIVDAKGNIYFSFGKKVLAFDSEGNQLWEFYRSGNWWTAAAGNEPLAIGQDGTLYVPGRGKLYAFGPESTPPPENQPPNCVIELQKDGVEINEINAGEFFDIYVGDSTDDVAIRKVRFSSDDSRNGIPEGEWTDWHDWDTSSEDWNADTKIKKWSFATPGNKEVWIELKDSNNTTSTCSADILAMKVTPPENQPPVVLFTHSPENPKSGEVVTFNASSSTDPDGQIVSYEWNFGDGEIDEGCIVTHRFRGGANQPKNYTVLLALIDDKGSKNSDAISIIIKPLRKILEVTHQPDIPIPNQPVFARMTILYNWIKDNDYVVTKIHYEADGFSGIGTISIWNMHSSSVWYPIWVANILSYGEKEKIYYPKLSTTYYGGDTFEGIRVDAVDAMNIYIEGLAGIHFSLNPFFETNSTYFEPGYTKIPNLPIEALNLNLAHLCSPGDLQVYDSQGNVTGLVDGEIKEEIPNSIYNAESETIIIFSPEDVNSYRYEIVGTDTGIYALDIISIENGEAVTFTAIDIPTTPGEIHQYTLDWDTLSQNENGVTLQIDADGDGVFEKTIIADNDLTHDEFILQTETTIDCDPDTLNLKGKGKFVTAYIKLPEGYEISEIDISSIIINNLILALTKPTETGDYDNDGIPDLMVKFDKAEVQAILEPGEGVTLILTGKVFYNESYIDFKGSNTIRVINPGESKK